MKSKKRVLRVGGGSDRQRLGERKKRALGEKQNLMERQRQRASQPVREKKKKGKQRLWKRSMREERESICHRRLPQTDYSCLQNSLWCVWMCVCLSISLNPLTVTAWGVHDLANHWWEGPCPFPSPLSQAHTPAQPEPHSFISSRLPSLLKHQIISPLVRMQPHTHTHCTVWTHTKQTDFCHSKTVSFHSNRTKERESER